MRTKKLLLTSLLIAGAAMSMNSANAATQATQTLQCTLCHYADISSDSSAVNTSGIDVETGNLNNAINAKFNVKLNSNQTLYLRANANSSTTNEKAFFKKGSDIYVILAHTGNKPTVAAINNAKSATPIANDNANVIAYKVTGITITGASSSVTPSFNATTNQYDIAAKPGASNVTTNIGTVVVPNTYSYLDTAGTYQAIVTLTTSAT